MKVIVGFDHPTVLYILLSLRFFSLFDRAIHLILVCVCVMFEWASTPDSLPSVGSSGESAVSVTGGGTLRSGSLFGVVRIEQDTFEASCRGFIGAGQRVCIRTDCSVASHASKKHEWSKLVGDDTSGIFIRGVSDSSSSDASDVLFCQPVLQGHYIRTLDWNEMELRVGKQRLHHSSTRPPSRVKVWI